MSDPCTLCKPWDDGTCAFGCSCRDCDEGRKYEAFVTNPFRDKPSVAECQAYLAYLRGGEVGLFRFDDGDEDDDREDDRYISERDEYAERGLCRADFY